MVFEWLVLTFLWPWRSAGHETTLIKTSLLEFSTCWTEILKNHEVFISSFIISFHAHQEFPQQAAQEYLPWSKYLYWILFGGLERSQDVPAVP